LTGDVPGFVIHGQPRTKKTSNRVVTVGPMCRTCGKRTGFPKVLPSEAYVEWEMAALRECVTIKAALSARGWELPIVGPVSVEAHIYLTPAADGKLRRDVGDVAGFIQAIGDMLEAAGIIANDRQIEDWDGTRRHADGVDPRVEVFITVLESVPVQESLLCP